MVGFGWPTEMKSDVIFYDVKSYVYDPDARRYPVAVHRERVGRYSTVEKAETAMEERIKAADLGSSARERFHSWSIQEIGIDVPYWHSFYDEHIYDGVGNFRGTVREGTEPFGGVDQKDCRFGVTDLVEFICGGKVLIGVVSALPPDRSFIEQATARLKQSHEERSGPRERGEVQSVTFLDQTDNSYRVLFGSSTCHHDHLPEARLFHPSFRISRRKQDQLHEWVRYEQEVFRRFNEFGGGLRNTWLEVQLNSFVSGKIEEPHVVVSSGYDYLVLSIETLKTLHGKPNRFKPEDIEAAKNFVRANTPMLRKGFLEMLESETRG